MSATYHYKSVLRPIKSVIRNPLCLPFLKVCQLSCFFGMSPVAVHHLILLHRLPLPSSLPLITFVLALTVVIAFVLTFVLNYPYIRPCPCPYLRPCPYRRPGPYRRPCPGPCLRDAPLLQRNSRSSAINSSIALSRFLLNAARAWSDNMANCCVELQTTVGFRNVY